MKSTSPTKTNNNKDRLPSHLPESMWPDAARLLAIEIFSNEAPVPPAVAMGGYTALSVEIQSNQWWGAMPKHPFAIRDQSMRPVIDHDLIDFRRWNFNWIGWVLPGGLGNLLKNQVVFPGWDAVQAHKRIHDWMLDAYIKAGHRLVGNKLLYQRCR